MTQSVWIGNNTYINGDLIISITEAKHPLAKKMIKTAKEEGHLLDYTAGGTRESVILFNDGRIILSHMEPYEIVEGLKNE